jgi:hypothetical protein
MVSFFLSGTLAPAPGCFLPKYLDPLKIWFKSEKCVGAKVPDPRLDYNACSMVRLGTLDTLGTVFCDEKYFDLNFELP